MGNSTRVREKQWVAVIALNLLGFVSPRVAHAVTVLKQVQVSNGSQVDLLFDGKVQGAQIHTDFVGDVIQLSIQDVSVYPAKISSVNGGSLTKIFAYQYAPKLVRCRLTVKGKAEDYRGRLEVKPSGRILTVRMQGEAVAKAEASSEPDEEERALLSRVMAAKPDGAKDSAKADAKPEPKQEAKAKDSITVSAAAPTTSAPAAGNVPNTENLPIHLSGENRSLGGAKPLPSPWAAFGKMSLVLGLFGMIALGLKQFAKSKAEARLSGAGALAGAKKGAKVAVRNERKGGWLGTLTRFARNSLSREGRMIEVLSNHHLGPKKSISVVRIAGRVLVLGVSNESINLITQLSGGEALEDALDQMDEMDLGDLVAGSDSEPQFSDLLRKENARPAPANNPYAQQPTPPRVAVHAQQAAAYAQKPAQAQRPQRPSQPQAQPAAYANPSGAAAYAAHQPLPAAVTENSVTASVRAKIRNRLEGLKPL